MSLIDIHIDITLIHRWEFQLGSKKNIEKNYLRKVLRGKFQQGGGGPYHFSEFPEILNLLGTLELKVKTKNIWLSLLFLYY